MSTLVRLPREEFFSENYLDAFYRAHVAGRTRGGNLDEDIAAIEAEIRKVERYQSELRRYKFDKHLNSCGNSECSDADDLESSLESSPTSVFKVYNSSTTSKPGLSPDSIGSDSSPFFLLRGPDIFTWAVGQQISHDHNYCHPDSLPQQTHIDHGTVTVNDIQWHLLSTPKRAQAVYKLSCILQQRPSERHSPTFSSLDLLPTSLAHCIRKTGSIGITGNSKKSSNSSRVTAVTTAAVTGSTKEPSVTANSSSVKTEQNIDIKEIKAKQRANDSKAPANVMTTPTSTPKVPGGGPMTRSSSRKKTRSTPYSKTAARNIKQPNIMEVTRVRNISSCSEDGEDPVVID